ncbi:hypothetical protein [Prosthecobacter vanneervenii]|uniref:Uncharacterized protein n=1 Tax=Prosthecobacter vanneervenii TaxID=48466 RepID=A0A7W7Y8P1_9BACT|nr:hypothetical protein [Prosthecobacter vanneervenii]MBB5031681.1 hypothetical protein [Prosthecobacter vanneervenii]
MKASLAVMFLLSAALSVHAQTIVPAAPAEAPLTTSDLLPLPGDELLAPEPASAPTPTAPPTPADPDLPQPFDATTLGPVIQNSPFTRIVSISDSLVLTGMAYVNGKPVVTIFDKNEKQSLVVSEEPNLKGWKLMEATPTTNIERAQAKIAIGGETFSIRHSVLDKNDLTKGKSDKGGDKGPRSDSSSSDRYNRGSRGPSEEDRKKYESLSDKAKEKFRDAMREKFSDEKFRNAPEEDRRNAIRAMFDKIQKEDGGAK